MKGLLTKDEFVDFLRELKGFKSVSQFARESDVTPQFMGKVLDGSYNPGSNLADVHGYEMVVMYRKKITQRGNDNDRQRKTG